ncbi:MAG: RNA 3'-terminal phosphate cyclase [Thermoflexales bacterium]|nr:RNA 3'-terminal phosphate cyclase [Thermoflexales bacterium]
MITIDGSYGEGGGQIIRSALALAALTGQELRIEAIRAGRQKPGLQAQHLTAVRAAAAVCGAELRGDALGSLTLEFHPGGPPQAGEYLFDVAQARQGGSAGSATLVFQTVFLPLALSGEASSLTIRGGTHVPWSPPLPYLRHVFLPMVWRLGLRAEATLKRYGWYPAGGGEAEFRVSGSKLQVSASGAQGSDAQSRIAGFDLTERGELKQVQGVAAVSNLPSHIAQRMANRAVNVLKATKVEPVKVEAAHVEADGPGVGIFLFAEYQHGVAGFCAYGRKGLPAEKVADEACQALLAHHQSGAATDPHLADQLILAAVLTAGAAHWTTSCITQHLLTNAWVTQQFIPCHIQVTGGEGQPGDVRLTSDV